MRNIFITGGTGFIGLNLLEYALYHFPDMRFWVLTRNSCLFEDRAPSIACHANVKTYNGDVRTFKYPTMRFDYIIHGALDLSDLDDSGIGGAARMAQFAKEQDCPVLYLSSGAVYHNPLTIYGTIKLYGEHILAMAKKVRLFTFAGNYLPDNDKFAIGRFIRQAKGDGPISLYGGSKVYRSYMHTSEMARWCWEILQYGQAGQAYNVGAEEVISIHDLAYKIAALFGIRVDEKPGMEQESYYVPDTHITREALGLSNDINLCEAIQRTIDWQKVSTL